MFDKLKNKLNSNINYLYILFFIGVFILHLFFRFSNDDINYFNTILDKMSLNKFIIMRYNTWTSRIIIESVLVVISRYIYLWRIIDSLMMVLLFYSINKLCFKKNNLKNMFIVALMVLIYPLIDLTGAGFASCTTNYLWPLSLMFFSFLPYRYIILKEKINNRKMIMCILSLIYACNQEQCVCIIFVVSLIMLILNIKNKSDYKYPLISLIISIVSLVFILTCPGNELRSIIEMNKWYPDYINANIMDKIYLAIVSSVSILVSNGIVLWLFSLILFIVIISIKVRLIDRIISFILLIITTILSGFRFVSLLLRNSYVIFDYRTSIGHVFTFSFSNFLVLFLCLLLFICIFYLLYVIYNKRSLIYIFIILLGCGTRIMIGFSPTIFASGRRTAIFLYYSIIMVIILLWKDNFSSFKKIYKKIFIFLVTLCMFVNIIMLFVKM